MKTKSTKNFWVRLICYLLAGVMVFSLATTLIYVLLGSL